MKENNYNTIPPNQENIGDTASRKDKHLELALKSQVEDVDSRFYYEPMLSGHPKGEELPVKLGEKTMKFPLWISSMTGGTPKTNTINTRLAEAAKKFGLGMGVGSARIALESPEKIKGFDLRGILGEDAPFYLNFGIAQIEKRIQTNSLHTIEDLAKKLQADGIIIHVNPLQEWMQPEGDRILTSPLSSIKKVLKETNLQVIVKEVGQGFGKESMRELLQLPLAAIEFAANGGTNFSKVELLRNKTKSKYLMPFIGVGHSAEEMVEMSNDLIKELQEKVQCPTLIISGGIKNFLDGYYYIQKSTTNAMYGQASEMLRRAQESQQELEEYIQYQIEGLQLAHTFLTLKDKKK